MKVQCTLQENCAWIELTLTSCTFENDIIQKHFLSNLSINIQKLEVLRSNIRSIAHHAFNSSVFTSLMSLTIDNQNYLNIDEFKFILDSRDCFIGLSGLSSLILKNNPIIETHDNPLFYLSESLTQLTIENITQTWDLAKLYPSSVLNNILSMNVANNNFPSLNSECFSGVSKNVRILSIRRSNIQSIESETFDEFKSLKQLSLHQNKLVNLPADIFKKIISLTSLDEAPAIKIRENEWLCNCQLVKLQSTIRNHEDIFDNPACFLPIEVTGNSISDIEICHPDPETTNDDITSESDETTNQECDDDSEDEDCYDTTTNSPETSSAGKKKEIVI